MELPFPVALMRAHQAQANAIRPRLAEIGLSPGQPKILDLLTACNGCMQRELAERCALEPATISRLLDKMEGEGLITRAPSAGDKRAVHVFLTDLGRDRREAFQAVRREVEARELAGFSPEERARFYAFLLRLQTNLTEYQKEDVPT